MTDSDAYLLATGDGSRFPAYHRLPCHDWPVYPVSTWAFTAEELERARLYCIERGWVRSDAVAA